MTQAINNTIVVIPSLNPDDKLITYVNSLISKGFQKILIINDGSSADYDPVFKTISKIKDCLVLTHPENKGKGEALKTAYAYIKDNAPDCKGIVTADSDGQHAVNDVFAVAEAISESPSHLVLGVRNFSKNNTPFKSLVGNRLTSALIFILFGTWLWDTQTGLRGFSYCLIDKMLFIKGSRYEYEMQVLIDFIRSKIPICQVEIETIYENNNQASHFRVVRDAFWIFKVIISNFVLFSSSSLLSAIIDLSLAAIFLFLLEEKLAEFVLLRIAIATVIARVISIGVNYLLNKSFVFKSKEGKSLRRYVMLAIAIMASSTLSVYFLHTGLAMDEMLAKLIADSLLFFLSYRIQERWVFKKIVP